MGYRYNATYNDETIKIDSVCPHCKARVIVLVQGSAEWVIDHPLALSFIKWGCQSDFYAMLTEPIVGKSINREVGSFRQSGSCKNLEIKNLKDQIANTPTPKGSEL
jgi:hypothetical protein